MAAFVWSQAIRFRADFSSEHHSKYFTSVRGRVQVLALSHMCNVRFRRCGRKSRQSVIGQKRLDNQSLFARFLTLDDIARHRREFAEEPVLHREGDFLFAHRGLQIFDERIHVPRPDAQILV